MTTLGIIAGSHRVDSQSTRVATYMIDRLKIISSDVSCELFDLKNNPLPLWDEGVWGATETWTKVWQPVSKRLQSCDAFVVIAPEWAGMVPPGLKNFFLLCSTADVGHKPGLIVGVSSTRGGSYPISELRTSSYKNNRICYIPEHLILRDVTQLLNAEVPTADDQYIRGRIDYCLRLLIAYADSFKSIRSSGLIDHKSYPFGM
jgi:NAD(P)H-dependent FMN reductase